MQVFKVIKRARAQLCTSGMKKALRANFRWLVLLGIIVWGCDYFKSSADQTKDDSTAALADTVQYYMETFEQNAGDSLNQNLISVRLHFPHFTSGASHKVRDSLNTFVKNLILAPEFDTKKPKKPEDLIKQLEVTYKSLQQDFPGYTLPWHLSRAVVIVYNTPKVLSIFFEESVFTGGAHPNTTRFYYSFDMKSGRPFQLSDLFVGDYQEPLNRIAEKKFRELEKIKPNQSLKKSGFWFENDSFSVKHNFAITRTGILFYFNRYEIAPYADGPIELELKAKLISDLIKNKALFQL